MTKIYATSLMPPKKILPRALAVSFLLSALLVPGLINPEKTELLTCQFFRLTGHSCPTCGLTRSFHAFSHMDFMESIRFHLMGPFIYAAFLLILIKISAEIATGREIKLKINPGTAKAVTVFIFCALFCFWIIRLIQEL